MFKDFLDLLFPEFCIGCRKALSKGENTICIYCMSSLPTINTSPVVPLSMEQRLWGRLHVNAIYGFIRFRKGGIGQKLIFGIKYRNKKMLGRDLGKRFANVLKENGETNFDLIVPVPMHPRKQKMRGYNQAEVIAEGMAEVLGIFLDTETVEKTVDTKTQTRKNRFQRWNTTQKVYRINQPETFKNQRILLVDDVITTGATFEMLTNIITSETFPSSISLAALAVAE